MREFIAFLFWPVPAFKNKWDRLAGSVGTWFFCWTYIFILVLCVSAIVCFFAGPAFATNTTAYDRGTISIVLDGSTNWVWSTDLSAYDPPPQGIVIYSIQFNSSAASDTVAFRNGSLSAMKFFATVPAGGVESAIKYYPYGKRCLPFILGTDVTLDTPANSLILIEVEPW